MPAAIIIPAFNEQQTVADVVAAVLPIGETIVVDHGSADRTADQAYRAGAKVIQSPTNRGKGNAIALGLRSTREQTVILLDADLVGITRAHVLYMLNLYQSGDYQQVQARVAGTAGIVTGQRCGDRRLWEIASRKAGGWAFELAANQLCGKCLLLDWSNVRHRPKSQKYSDGLARQVKMWVELFLYEP